MGKARTMTTGFINGELVVQGAPSGDCPPDVYEFEFGESRVRLCLKCRHQRWWDGEPAPEFWLLTNGGVRGLRE